MKNSRYYLILTEIFYALTGALLIFLAAETFWPRLVLNYFNINYLVVLWLIAGAWTLFKQRR